MVGLKCLPVSGVILGAYFINEDLPNNRAVVHREPCGFARARDKKQGTGQWHGPYDSFNEAFSKAKSLGRANCTSHQQCCK